MNVGNQIQLEININKEWTNWNIWNIENLETFRYSLHNVLLKGENM